MSRWLLAVLLGGWLTSPPAAADQPVAIVEAPLVDARGQQVAFASEAVGEAVVVVNPIWTGCSSLCPLTSAVMGEVAERLGDRLGREVRLVSLAIDPLEVPKAQLEGWVADYGSVPGWLWLGGAPGAVDAVLTGLGEPMLGPIDGHPSVFLVVDGRTGRARRFEGIAEADDVLEAIEQIRSPP